jgi:hypothetical protein
MLLPLYKGRRIHCAAKPRNFRTASTKFTRRKRTRFSKHLVEFCRVHCETPSLPALRRCYLAALPSMSLILFGSLKLVRCPRSLAATLAALPSISESPFPRFRRCNDKRTNIRDSCTSIPCSRRSVSDERSSRRSRVADHDAVASAKAGRSRPLVEISESHLARSVPASARSLRRRYP